VALDNDTGTSNSDRSTADATVSGDLVRADGPIEDITIEFDVDGDGEADGTATTDVAGLFSFTPTELSEGPQRILARAVFEDPLFGSFYQPWVATTFVYASDPDSTEAQDWATALADFEADLATAEATGASGAASAAAGYNVARESVEADHADALAVANAARDASVASSNADYEAAVLAAQGTYDAALATAGSAFATAIGAYSNAVAQAAGDFAVDFDNTARLDALRSARESYASSEAGAANTYTAAFYAVGDVHVGWVGSAQSTYATTAAGAVRTYATAYANAEAARREALANADYDYYCDEADSYAAAIDAFATSDGTPWSAQDSSEADAIADDWDTGGGLADRNDQLNQIEADRIAAVDKAVADETRWLDESDYEIARQATLFANAKAQAEAIAAANVAAAA